MPSQRLRLAGTLTGLALLAGCAGHVTTEIESTGMANPEVALRRSMDLVNNQMSQLGGPRAVQPIPAMASVPASIAPIAVAPGEQTLPQRVDGAWLGIHGGSGALNAIQIDRYSEPDVPRRNLPALAQGPSEVLFPFAWSSVNIIKAQTQPSLSMAA